MMTDMMMRVADWQIYAAAAMFLRVNGLNAHAARCAYYAESQHALSRVAFALYACRRSAALRL